MIPYLTRTEAAALLGVTPQTVSNYIQKGLLKESSSNTSTAPTKKILRSSVEQLLSEGHDVLDLTRAIDQERTALRQTQEVLQKSIANDKAMIQALKARSRYLEHLDMVADILTAYLMENDAIDRREKAICADIIAGKPRNELETLYGINWKRIVQIFNKAVRKMTLQSRPTYNELLAQCQKQDDILKGISKQSEILEKQIARQAQAERELGKTISVPMILISDVASCRLSNCLGLIGIAHVHELVVLSLKAVGRLRNLGRKSVSELKQLMANYGLQFYNIDSLLNPLMQNRNESYKDIEVSELLKKKEELKEKLK